MAIWEKTCLVTFNGPALMVELAEYPKIFDYTERYMLKALCSAEPIGEVLLLEWWTEEFLDWGREGGPHPRTDAACFGRLGGRRRGARAV